MASECAPAWAKDDVRGLTNIPLSRRDYRDVRGDIERIVGCADWNDIKGCSSEGWLTDVSLTIGNDDKIAVIELLTYNGRHNGKRDLPNGPEVASPDFQPEVRQRAVDVIVSLLHEWNDARGWMDAALDGALLDRFRAVKDLGDFILVVQNATYDEIMESGVFIRGNLSLEGVYASVVLVRKDTVDPTVEGTRSLSSFFWYPEDQLDTFLYHAPMKPNAPVGYRYWPGCGKTWRECVR